jgi:hypothetical protein
MLFLMNDVVFSLDGVARGARLRGRRFSQLSMPAIIRMGQELYATEPLLQHSRPDRAQRLGALISSKAPMINAALFVAPSHDCAPADVTVRFVSAQFEVMAELYTLQQDGGLNAVKADRHIWRRLAA